jgi:NADH-quinone oxidoreductase subunit E
MLNAEEKVEIDREIGRYEYRHGACIDALRILQQHRGWISDETIGDIADYLDLSPDVVEGVATFYNGIYRKPVGKHIILLCDSVSCWMKGCDALRARIKKELKIEFGETTPDKQFTLLPIQCLGACDHAPVFMIDADLYTDCRPDQLERIFEDVRRNHTGNGKTSHSQH